MIHGQLSVEQINVVNSINRLMSNLKHSSKDSSNIVHQIGRYIETRPDLRQYIKLFGGAPIPDNALEIIENSGVVHRILSVEEKDEAIQSADRIISGYLMNLRSKKNKTIFEERDVNIDKLKSLYSNTLEVNTSEVTSLSSVLWLNIASLISIYGQENGTGQITGGHFYCSLDGGDTIYEFTINSEQPYSIPIRSVFQNSERAISRRDKLLKDFNSICHSKLKQNIAKDVTEIVQQFAYGQRGILPNRNKLLEKKRKDTALQEIKDITMGDDTDEPVEARVNIQITRNKKITMTKESFESLYESNGFLNTGQIETNYTIAFEPELATVIEGQYINKGVISLDALVNLQNDDDNDDNDDTGDNTEHHNNITQYIQMKPKKLLYYMDTPEWENTTDPVLLEMKKYATNNNIGVLSSDTEYFKFENIPDISEMFSNDEVILKLKKAVLKHYMYKYGFDYCDTCTCERVSKHCLKNKFVKITTLTDGDVPRLHRYSCGNVFCADKSCGKYGAKLKSGNTIDDVEHYEQCYVGAYYDAIKKITELVRSADYLLQPPDTSDVYNTNTGFRPPYNLCPNCHVLVSRNEGCNSVTCESCKTEFCFSCGSRTGVGRLYADHSSHKCEHLNHYPTLYDENRDKMFKYLTSEINKIFQNLNYGEGRQNSIYDSVCTNLINESIEDLMNHPNDPDRENKIKKEFNDKWEKIKGKLSIIHRR